MCLQRVHAQLELPDKMFFLKIHVEALSSGKENVCAELRPYDAETCERE